MFSASVNEKIIVWILWMMLFVSACGGDVDVDYLGDSYPPTSHVDVYFSEDDITEDYRVMGRATANGDDTEGLKESLIEKALEGGADGIIFEEFDQVETGEHAIVNGLGEISVVTPTSVL